MENYIDCVCSGVGPHLSVSVQAFPCIKWVVIPLTEAGQIMLSLTPENIQLGSDHGNIRLHMQ